MAKKTKFSGELKALGKDLASALSQMRKSDEYKDLEKEFIKGVKSISKSLSRSVKSASKSPASKRIRLRLKRVIKSGTREGKVEAQKAQSAAISGIRKARQAIKHMKK